MPDYQTLDQLNKKYMTLDELERQNAGGQPTAQQKDFTQQKTVEQLRQVQAPPEEEAGVGDYLKGVWNTTGAPLMGLAGAAAHDVGGLYRSATQGDFSGESELANMMITPMQETFKKALDPNRGFMERVGYGAAGMIPFAGPMMADIGERMIPKGVYGTPKEKAGILGEAVGMAVSPLAVKGLGQARQAGAASRLRKGYAKIAQSTGEDITKAEIGAGFPLFDDYLKRETGTTLGGAPQRNLRNMSYKEAGESAPKAVADFFDTNVKPVQAMLGPIDVPLDPIFQRGMDTLGALTKEKLKLKKKTVPAFATDLEQIFKGKKSLTDLIGFREEINGLLSDAYSKTTNIEFSEFLRSNPRGKFLNALQEGIRESIDTTLDQNAGQYAGQAKQVFGDAAKLMDLNRAIQKGARRADLADTAVDAQTLLEKFPLVRGTIGLLTGGKFGSMGGTTHELTRLERAAQARPQQRLKQAGKMIEKPGWGGLIPPGRTAMEPVAQYNWSPAMAGISSSNPLMPPSGPPPTPPVGPQIPPFQPPPGPGAFPPPGPFGGAAPQQGIPSGWKPQGPKMPTEAMGPEVPSAPVKERILDTEGIELPAEAYPVIPGEASRGKVLNPEVLPRPRTAAKPPQEEIPTVQPRERLNVMSHEEIKTKVPEHLKKYVEPEKKAAKQKTIGDTTFEHKGKKDYYGAMMDEYEVTSGKYKGSTITVNPNETLEAKFESVKKDLAESEAKVAAAKKPKINKEVQAKMMAKLKASQKPEVTKTSVSELKKASDTSKEYDKKIKAGAFEEEAKYEAETGKSYWDEVKEEKTLGGTTGAKLYKGPSGEQYVVKHGKTDAHTANEVEAGKLYQILGVNTPSISKVTIGGKDAAVSKFNSAAKPLNKSINKEQYYKKISKDFVADALMGNWDSIGLEFDNILIDPNLNPIRIDPAGSLRFRAMGGAKKLSSFVNEIETLRDPVKNPQAAEVFKGLTDKDIADQIGKILPKKMEFLKAVGEDLKPIMEDRFDDLKKRLTKIQSKEIQKAKAPATGTVKTEKSPAPMTKIVPNPGRKGWLVKELDTGKTLKTITTPGDEGGLEAKQWAKKFEKTYQGD